MSKANPSAQHARSSWRGGINSYLRGRGSRSERGCVRVCARARAPGSHSVSPFNVTDTFPRSPRPPNRTRDWLGPEQGPAPPPPGPLSLNRAPINQSLCCQSADGFPRQSAARAVATAIAAPGRGRRRWPRPWLAGFGEVNTVRYPSAARGTAARLAILRALLKDGCGGADAGVSIPHPNPSPAASGLLLQTQLVLFPPKPGRRPRSTRASAQSLHCASGFPLSEECASISIAAWSFQNSFRYISPRTPLV